QVPRSQPANSVETVFVACAIPRFCQSVGIQKDGIAVGQSQAMNWEAGITEHSQRHSSGILRLHSVAVDVKKRQMACADKLNRTIVCGSAYYEGRKLPSQSALAKNAIGVLHHAVERETRFGETAKRCVE